MCYPMTCPHCKGTKIMPVTSKPQHQGKPCYVCDGKGELQGVPPVIAREIEQFQNMIDKIREAYHISDPGEVISHCELDCCPGSDDRLEVTADGMGGATLARIEGDHDNTLCHNSRDFETEDEACQALAWIDDNHEDMEDIFDGENPHHQAPKADAEEVS